jgi:hypothetical protein
MTGAGNRNNNEVRFFRADNDGGEQARPDDVRTPDAFHRTKSYELLWPVLGERAPGSIWPQLPSADCLLILGRGSPPAVSHRPVEHICCLGASFSAAPHAHGWPTPLRRPLRNMSPF